MTIVGHETKIATLLDALRGPRPHHAWLLSGPEGVGKASVAKLVARRLLAEAAGPDPGSGLEIPGDHSTAHLIDAFAHADFLLLDRLPADPKMRETPRNQWPPDVQLARSINTAQARELNRRFATRPTHSERRFVVIDGAEFLEMNAANALLKNIEEPPTGTVFLLVSHAPGRLLPTIRSRCRQLRFSALSDGAMTSLLSRELPDADAPEIAALAQAGAGSPGRALRYAGLDIGAIDRALAALAANGDRDNAQRSALAQSLSAKAAQARYEAFLSRAPAFIAAEARRRQGPALKAAIGEWEAARGLAAVAIPQSFDPASIVFEIAGHVAALAPEGAHAKA